MIIFALKIKGYIIQSMEMSNFIKVLKRIPHKLAAPVLKETTFFLFFLVFTTPTLLVYLFRELRDGEGLSLIVRVFKDFSLAVLFSYIFTSIIYFTRSRFVKILFYIILLILFAINLYLRLVFGLTLSPLIIVLIGETTEGEASEFISTFMTTPKAFMAFFISFVVALLFMFEKRINKLLQKLLSPKIVRHSITFLLTIMLLTSFTQIHIYPALFKTPNTYEMEKWKEEHDPLHKDYVTGLIYALYGPNVVAKENTLAIETTYKVSKLKHVRNDSTNTPLTIIYVLGESFIKNHSNIYGYELCTNPHMASEIASGNMFAFTDVISPGNVTNFVAKNSFCTNSITEKEYRWFDYPYFPMIFKSAGFDVFMNDNQFNYDMNSNSTFTLISFLFNKKIQELSYTDVCSNRFDYDGDLVDDFFKNHQLGKKDDLVLFHLMGQHIKASERFPHTPEFMHFTTDSIKNDASYMTKEKKQNIADYDNATYYNDFVIWKIIEKIRDKNALLVYFPDHGEEVYDYRDNEGRCSSDDKVNLLKYHFDLPFFIWCSNTYQSLYPEIMDQIRTSIDRPFETDNIAHMMFDLANISTPLYKPERDLLSPKYVIKPRIVYEVYDTELLNYDEMRATPKNKAK